MRPVLLFLFASASAVVASSSHDTNSEHGALVFARQCVQCGPPPQCDCAADGTCTLLSQTCTQCASVQCLGGSGSSSSGSSVGSSDSGGDSASASTTATAFPPPATGTGTLSAPDSVAPSSVDSTPASSSPSATEVVGTSDSPAPSKSNSAVSSASTSASSSSSPVSSASPSPSTGSSGAVPMLAGPLVAGGIAIVVAGFLGS